MPDTGHEELTCQICNTFKARSRRQLSIHLNHCEKDDDFKRNLIDQYKALKEMRERSKNNIDTFDMDDNTCDLTDNGTIECILKQMLLKTN